MSTLATPTAPPLDLVRVEQLMRESTRPQPPIETLHYFAPGVYVREMRAPAGSVVLGCQHLTECINVVLSGKARVYTNGEVTTLSAGSVFTSKAGSQKLAYIEEDFRFLNIHPNPDDCRDMPTLESRFITGSPLLEQPTNPNKLP